MEIDKVDGFLIEMDVAVTQIDSRRGIHHVLQLFLFGFFQGFNKWARELAPTI